MKSKYTGSKVVMGASIPSEMKAEIIAIADKEGRSLSNVVTRLLEKALLIRG